LRNKVQMSQFMFLSYSSYSISLYSLTTISVYDSVRRNPAHETVLPINPSDCDYQPRRNAAVMVPW